MTEETKNIWKAICGVLMKSSCGVRIIDQWEIDDAPEVYILKEFSKLSIYIDGEGGQQSKEIEDQEQDGTS